MRGIYDAAFDGVGTGLVYGAAAVSIVTVHGWALLEPKSAVRKTMVAAEFAVHLNAKPRQIPVTAKCMREQ